MRQMLLILPVILLPLAGGLARATELSFPFPVTAIEAVPPVAGRYDLPVGPWDGTAVAVRALEGMVDRRAYRLDAAGRSMTEVLAPLRDQLVAAGFEVLLDCETRGCGGFDFRFRTEVLPEPGMHVDLGEFRFLSVARPGEALGVLVSRSASSAYVQVIRVGETALPGPVPPEAAADGVTDGMTDAGPAPAPDLTPDTAAPALTGAGDPSGLTARLDAGLPVALDDLVFASGAAALEAGDYPSLAALAGWLRADPARKLMLVGHTDASGGMEANIALSKRRAEAVRQALMMRHDVPPGQVTAQGAGPLAPRASNATEEGRQKNRRVEAVPAPT